MSEIRVTSGADVSEIDVSALTAILDSVGGVLTFGLADSRPLNALAPGGTTDATAQVEEVLLAVVTAYAQDASSRLRERPLWIAEIPAAGATVSLTSALWKAPDPVPVARGGRVRLLRLLRTRAQPAGTTLQALLFGADPIEAADDPMELNPPDVGGSLLGISRPIEWKS